MKTRIVLVMLCLVLAPDVARAQNDYDDAIKRGDEHRDNREYDEAILAYSEAIELIPDSPRAYASRGDIYVHKREYKKAIADFDKAVALKPDYVYPYSRRGYAYYMTSDYDRAIWDYTKCLVLDPDYRWAYTGRGKVYCARRASMTRPSTITRTPSG